MVPWFPVQAQLLSWANLQPGVDHAHQTCMAVDANSNVYITGWFQNTVDFDPDTGSFTLTSVSNSEDIFLAKYDANGKFKWVLGFGGTFDEQGISLAIDHSGHILMAALFRSICDFDAGGNVANVTGNGQNDFAIAKYDSSGNFTWVKSFGSVTNESKIQIDVDALNSNLEDFKLQGITEQGISNIKDEGNKQNLVYYFVTPIYEKKVVFIYLCICV